MIARPTLRYLARGDRTGTLSVSQIEDGLPLWRDEHAHRGAITHLAWSPDGLFLASGGQDGAVHIWQSTSGALLHSFVHGQAVQRLRWSADNARIASVSAEHVRLWSLQPVMAAAA